MKNVSTPVNAEMINAQQNFIEEVENFDKKEFGDMLSKLDELKFSPRKKVLDKIIDYAKSH